MDLNNRSHLPSQAARLPRPPEQPPDKAEIEISKLPAGKMTALVGERQDSSRLSAQKIRRLSGHNGPILCCHSPLSDPNIIATSGQDGKVCLFDIRSKSAMQTFESFGQDSISSICFIPGSTHVIYAAAGATVYCLDIRVGSSGGETLHKCSFNTDEINQISLNAKGSLLAAADDSGEIKVIDLNGHKLFKTLRGVHTNICSTVQFHPHRPWELISGGLDAKMVKWDLCKGRPLKTIDQGTASQCSSSQLCNPPFVHAIAIPEVKSCSEAGKLIAVARGNGAVEFFDLMLEKWSPSVGQTKSQHGKKKGIAETHKDSLELFDNDLDGHNSSVSCITFARFSQRKTLVISGSNDRHLKMWDLQCKNGGISSNTGGRRMLLSVDHKRKVNWIATSERVSENLFVADTSKKLTVYSIS